MYYSRIHNEVHALENLIKLLKEIKADKRIYDELTLAEMEEIETEVRDAKKRINKLSDDLFQAMKNSFCKLK